MKDVGGKWIKRRKPSQGKPQNKENMKKLIAKLCNADNRHKHADKVLVHKLNDWYVSVTQLESNDQVVYNKDRKGKL